MASSGSSRPAAAVRTYCYDALYALQHRGQESAGMATFNNHQITVVKDNGLVSHVFAETTLRALGGCRDRPHPLLDVGFGELDRGPAGLPLGRRVGFRHRAQRQSHQHHGAGRRRGMQFTSLLSDSDLVAEMLRIEVETAASLSTKALETVLAQAEGAYSMVVLEAGEIHAVRDPYGFRPLCLGRFGTEEAPEGWIVASESPALDVVGATLRARDRARVRW